MFKSLQWKIVLIYSLLLLFALQLIGVYLVQSLEQYYLNSFRSGLETQARLLSTLLAPRSFDRRSEEDIAHLVREFRGFWEGEITVLDRYGRVIGTSGNQEQLGRRLIRKEITEALRGNAGETIRVEPEQRERRFYLAYPLGVEGNSGVVYLNSSLKNVDSTLNGVKMILVSGTIIALVISLMLGLILSRTITVPVREITAKAVKMARGDFSQQIKAQETDEIGQLGRSFNYLASRLSRTLREISAEKGKVEAIINYMSDGIVALDGGGRTIHFNPAACRQLQLLRQIEPVLGENGLQILKELAGTETLHAFLQQRRPVTLDVSRVNPTCDLQVQVVAFQEEKGLPPGTLLVFHDVTREKETVRLQQQFVADVSHELRTPLTTIKSYVEALRDGATKEPVLCRRFLGVLEGETERMVSLVKDLLVLSQLDYHQIEWHKTEVDLRELVLEVAAQIRQKYNASRSRISVSIPPALPRALVDRDRAMQVFLNVLHNAMKYTPTPGAIEVAASTGQRMLQVVVSDTGVGIPSEDLPRVFERFYRVEKTRSRDFGGTGLGLSIARHIVEAHGGSIRIESVVGKGTRVLFTFPRADRERGGSHEGAL